MKNLLAGVALAAALGAGPLLAQSVQNTNDRNTSGQAVTRSQSDATRMQRTQDQRGPTAASPTMQDKAVSGSSTDTGMPVKKRHARRTDQGGSGGAARESTTTAELNRQELGRLR